ncbi:MAG TPA: outer membrane beta-barrel protein [Gammaproteobacteria bacterium]|nr:outer membrane beta-barrel protein [Gammaproteobacteria bacterium]
MFKKSLLATLALSAAPLAFAMQSTTPYLGASMGVNVNSSTNVNGNAGVYRGVPLKVFAGYGGLINSSFYLAGELSGVPGSAQMSNKNNMRTSYGYSLSLLPGLMLSDQTFAFMRAGFVRTEFSNVNNMATGGQLGVGMQTFLTQNVDLRGEYDYTAYRTVSGIHAPSADSYDLGLVYKFN